MNTEQENTGSKLYAVKCMLLSWLILTGFLLLAHWLSDIVNLSFPPALSAMLALFLALQCGLIKLHWVYSGTVPLLNFMPLFFVPAAAKVVEHSELISVQWPVLIACLFIVPLVGLIVIGWLMQRFGK
ncbi:CidA/LrgA family protein [Pseudoalteromonas sp. SSDWG2]|uniref:CidA/LrgA family protein n=1 Tax=Pseudoalteromonas sp. SSDWG2 TaxID=3139391 RepID=UPI003BAC0254